jgi:hypothetical protein
MVTIVHDATKGVVASLAGQLWLQAAGGSIHCVHEMNHAGNIIINKTNPTIYFQVSGSEKMRIGYISDVSYITSSSGWLQLTGYGGISTYGGNLQIFGGYHIIPEETSGGSCGNSTHRWAYGYIDELRTEEIHSRDSTIVQIKDTCYFTGGIFPDVNGTQDCGSVNYHWLTVRADYIRWDIDHDIFDSLDDLGIVKNYKSKTVSRRQKNGEVIKVDVIDKQSFPMLLDEDGFYAQEKVGGFLFGCAKSLAKKQDEHNAIILTLLDRIEKLETTGKQN